MKKTPLEQWIAEKVGRHSGDLTENSISRYQLERLRETIEYVTVKSPFYRGRLRGFSAGDLRTIKDLSRLPFTTSQDIRDYGPQFLCVSQSEIERVVTLLVPGASELPRRVYFTREDLELTIDFFHHGMSTIVEPGQKALILMPGDKPASVGDLLARALKRMGVEGIVHGVVEDPSKTAREILRYKTDCLVGLPTQVLSIAKHGEARKIPPGQIKNVLLSPDACLKSPHVPTAIVNELRKIWNCPVFNHYGTTEMGFGGVVECQAFSGHHLREADLYFEIIDPDSGLPLRPGELGEIVFTTLTRKGMPLVRYRTGDLARFLDEPCPCGTVTRRMERPRGRLHEMVRLRTAERLCITDFDKGACPCLPPQITNRRPTIQ
jgi:phenylacetate-coenzyme A ligase PaaK-like adenylate-forming protein